MKISNQLLIIVCSALMGLFFIVGTSLHSLNTSLIESRRLELVNLLTKSENLIQHYVKQQKSGAMTKEAAQSAAKDSITQLNNKNPSYYWINDENSLGLVHPDPSHIGKRTLSSKTADGRYDVDGYKDELEKKHFGMIDVLVKRGNSDKLQPKLQGVVEIPEWKWIVGTGFFYDSINNEFWSMAKQLIAISALILLFIIIISFTIYKKIMRSLGGEPDAATYIAHEISMGNLNVNASLKEKDNSSLIFKLNEMKIQLRELVRNIQQTGEIIVTGSHQIACGNSELSQRTEEQAASLQETAASMEQLTATVKNNADNAKIASQLAIEASDETKRGGDAMNEVVTTMQAIAAESGEIERIVIIIESIAFQTNILALNAAVEAARAGETGRGFAVVANEVRNLAKRSADAAKDITNLVNKSVERINEGKLKVSQAGYHMHEIMKSIEQLNNIVSEIASASLEQSDGIRQVNLAITQMDSVTQQNAAMVEQASAAATSLNEQAIKLQHNAKAFVI